MLDKTKAREIAVKYAEEVRKELSPQTIILFGSYVNGTPHEYSDIDIAVVVYDYTGDWLEASANLVGLAWKFEGSIEPHLMDETCDRSGFLEHIKKTGEIIYQEA